MAERIQITMRVSAFLRRTGKRWTAIAPRFAVATQGDSKEDAKQSLREALELWIESCVERGTLEDALREVGFRPVPWGTSPETSDRVNVSRSPASEAIGTESEIEISIPAYQVAAIAQLAEVGLAR